MATSLRSAPLVNAPAVSRRSAIGLPEPVSATRCAVPGTPPARWGTVWALGDPGSPGVCPSDNNRGDVLHGVRLESGQPGEGGTFGVGQRYAIQRVEQHGQGPEWPDRMRYGQTRE